MTSRPRSRSPTHSSVTKVVFSVEPSTSANGCLTPSMSMPRATTQHDSAKWTPSTINATRSSPDRSAAASLREGLAETLTVLALDVPPTLARTLRILSLIHI